MKKYFTALLLFCFAPPVFSQSEKNRVNIHAGPSFAGTGDHSGFSVSLMHEHDFTRRVGISNGLTTTIHFGKDRGLNRFIPGATPENRLMHFTTAGIQWNSFGQYHIIAKRDKKMSFHAGALVRFQSTSFPAQYTFSQNQRVYPEPFYVIYDYDKPNSVSAGYNMGLTYRTRIAPKFFTGVRVGFQNDTRGDVITSITLLLEHILPNLHHQD